MEIMAPLPPTKPGLLARAAAAARLVMTGKVDRTLWFGPLEPMAPVAPREVEGRRFDYRTGWNLVTTPRGAARIDFRELRALADNYDLMRLVIETRKDQLARLDWTIQSKDQAKRGAKDERIREVADFLARPDQEHDWGAWLRALVEDMLVIDAATLYPRKNRGGGLYALDLIDGATIKPVIDDHGRRPLPPAPAYQQILHGLPAVDYTSGELLYFPRNYRVDRVYGFPPVEQVVMTVNIALRRQLHQLEFYTSGTMPDALIGAPDNWAPQQIEDFQAYFDALLADNTAERRKVRFVPSGIAKGFVQTKAEALKDEYDEWLARITCYAFSVSPQWAVKAMNRATADSAQEQSLQEGLAPLRAWVKLVLDRCLADGFGFADLEFAWTADAAGDPKEQAEIAIEYLSHGVKTINEIRADLGLAKLAGGDTPLIFTATGAVPLAALVGQMTEDRGQMTERISNAATRHPSSGIRHPV